jgi:NitT/TauT family transport system ATP-binding protein
MKNPKLLVEDVYKRYDQKVVLDNIDLSVSPGEFCTLVGPSGCGKSTLLKLMLGQELQSDGIIKINGHPVGSPSPDRGIVFQKYSLFPNLTVLENVMAGSRFKRGTWWNPFAKNKADYEEALSYLEKVRLLDSLHKYPHELSGGMQQRAAIAQALIMKPPILLMDEPFGALDPHTREDLQVFILELWEKENLTIFFVTHDLEEACYLGSRLLVLSQYYTDDRGPQTSERGGKIVADYPLPRFASATTVKNDPEFKTFISNVRKEGFDPLHLQHASQFNLTHPDMFQTLTKTEYNRG